MKIVPMLADTKARYSDQVRRAAADARARVSTPGKEATYAAKLREALAYQADKTAGRYLAAEARRSGISLAAAAKKITAAAERTDGLLADIDEAELDALASIKIAGTVAEAYAALKACVF